MVRGHILTMAVAKAMAMLLNLRTSREPVELGMGLGEVQLRAMEALLRLVSMDRRMGSRGISTRPVAQRKESHYKFKTLGCQQGAQQLHRTQV